jgi:hypothetical protein|tara:strand:- start:660 stop:1001 length:342 start_codon:yes stop_codon:yes gene_type:complete
MDVVVNPASWIEISDFNNLSREYYCSTTGQPRKQGESVFRGSMIDLEGFYDICFDSAKQLAELIGYVTPEDVVVAMAERDVANATLSVALRKLEAANRLIESYNEFAILEADL